MRIVMTLMTVLVVAAPSVAQAQDVEPTGAIHAMTGSHRHYRRHHVHIPRYWHHHHRFGIALPPGTDRPGRSRTFIPGR